MNCKNCDFQLNSEDKYCNECGAKVVNERISIKSLLSGLLVSFGWDNRFFVTFRDLIVRPQVVFGKYLNGTRKKYTNPFTFFAIGTALSVFVLNLYSEELIQLSANTNLKSSETTVSTYSEDGNSSKISKKQADFMKEQEASKIKSIEFIYKYYYYLSFLLLPFFALVALFVFGKPDNYGEHLVINAYIQGLLFFFGLPIFFLSLLIEYDVYTGGSFLLTVIWYLYAYKKYRNYTLGKTLKKLLKFLGIFLFLFLFMLVVTLVMMVLKKM